MTIFLLQNPAKPIEKLNEIAFHIYSVQPQRLSTHHITQILQTLNSVIDYIMHQF